MNDRTRSGSSGGRPHRTCDRGGPRSNARIRLFIAAFVSIVLTIRAVPASADPPDNPIAPNPYPPDSLLLTSYDRVDPADYFVPGAYGVYFLSPTGLNCGIWLRGSFGCNGELPGAPDSDHIGWFNSDTAVHRDWAIRIGFP